MGAVRQLKGGQVHLAELRPGAVIVNRVRPPRLPARSVTSAADGRVDASRVRTGLATAGLDLAQDDLEGLVAETVEHAIRVQAEQRARDQLAEVLVDQGAR